ncbi:hypothetical protein RRF57_010791 [Xylaria bambusicola]|uniref:Secreted protein n=1 Tax=Xylaria bambusicola TaxID=326684 RepID=A0AAN7UVJ4_9PEZI
MAAMARFLASSCLLGDMSQSIILAMLMGVLGAGLKDDHAGNGGVDEGDDEGRGRDEGGVGASKAGSCTKRQPSSLVWRSVQESGRTNSETPALSWRMS